MCSICELMIVEWMLLSWHWCMVFSLTGFGFAGKGGLRIFRYGKLWSGWFELIGGLKCWLLHAV